MTQVSSTYIHEYPLWYPPLMTHPRFFYKPITLTALGVGFGILAYVAMTQDVLREGQEKKRV